MASTPNGAAGPADASQEDAEASDARASQPPTPQDVGSLSESESGSGDGTQLTG